MTTAEMPNEGDLWDGRYRILRSLSIATFQRVFAALDERNQQPIALKIVRPEAEDDFYGHWRRDAFLRSVLFHPGIPRTLGIGHGPWPYSVSEWVDGDNWHELILQRSVFTPAEVAQQMRASLSLVLALAKEGVVFFDVMPANIMLRGINDVVLPDFGVTKMRLDRVGQSPLFRFLSIQDQDYDAATLLALKAVAYLVYFMATGRDARGYWMEYFENIHDKFSSALAPVLLRAELSEISDELLKAVNARSFVDWESVHLPETKVVWRPPAVQDFWRELEQNDQHLAIVEALDFPEYDLGKPEHELWLIEPVVKITNGGGFGHVSRIADEQMPGGNGLGRWLELSLTINRPVCILVEHVEMADEETWTIVRQVVQAAIDGKKIFLVVTTNQPESSKVAQLLAWAPGLWWNLNREKEQK